MEYQATLSSHNHDPADYDVSLDVECSRCGGVVGRAQRFADGYEGDDLHWEAWEVYPARIVRDGPDGRRLDFLSVNQLEATRRGGRRRRRAPTGVQWECWRSNCRLPSMSREDVAARAEVAYRLGLRAIPVG